MRKIITVFQRNYDTDRLVRDELVPGADWVLAGEGIATRKYDGACCIINNVGVLFKRYDAKQGRQPPVGFIPAQDADLVTGHIPGWLQVRDGPEDKWFREALKNAGPQPAGTYEAIGPHFQGNPEGEAVDTLIRHGITEIEDCPRDFAGLRDYLSQRSIEGVVFHHPDGRMAKIKKRDFVKPESARWPRPLTTNP